MYQKYQPKSTKWPKRGRYILLCLIAIIWYSMVFTGSITPPKNVVLQKWQTIQTFAEWLSWTERLRMKLYLTTHTVDTKKIQTGTYVFSWSYTTAEYIEKITAGPTNDYIRYTVLEGWSLYDIDEDMTKKGMITKWSLLAKAQDVTYIQKLTSKYEFLQPSQPQNIAITTLEWFLYPDTYFLGVNADPIDALVQAALKRFDEKIYATRKSQLSTFTAKLQTKSLSLSLPWALALASVIEKEERNNTAKPTIAWIFINRLSQGIQLGADISLCYGLQQPYETCTPSQIVASLRDTDNLYNTRVHKGLPPTPISSISSATFDALLQYAPTSYLFYLHDTKGKIYYAETNAQHEENKRLYMLQ